MLKGKQKAKCPVAGCNATWEKNTASVDEGMARRMDRFFRVHVASEPSRAAATATYIDADDEDGYTQL